MKTQLSRFALRLTLGLLALTLTSQAAALDAGSRAPDIRARSLNGQQINLADLKGKVVIIDFWASWCKPCAKAMPVLDRLYKRYKDHGLVVIGVSVDGERRDAEKFLRGMNVSFPLIHDAGHSIANEYSPSTMPSSYIVDKRGVVRHVHRGFRQGDGRAIESQVRKLLQ